MEAPLVPQVLLQHGQFVRALAKSLLRDAHAADDVAQETWARYLEHGPPEGRGLRQWLRVVTRNLAVNLSRGERHRAARERAVVRSESLPSAREELEHAELLGVVVEAVLALEEPYRETIVDRYYRGLDSGAIAARSGTTAATVRSREHRALEKLRERLDRRFGGERRAWAAVLARIAVPPASGLAGGTSSAWRLGLAVALPLVAVTAAALWLRTRSTSSGSVPSPVVSAAPSTPSSPAAALAAPAHAGQRSPVASTSSGRENATNSTLAEIRGRFVFPGGVPAHAVSIEVSGWGANQERELKFGVPEGWVDPRGETDGDGRFSLRFEPPRAFQFTLDAKAPGHAEASWRWGEILPGATVDLGEVELPIGGTIEGRMVDARGEPLTGEHWMVYVRTVGLREQEGRDESQVIAPAHGATASFRLENVWPSRVELTAHSGVANWIDGPKVTVRSGETVTADIVYSGPSNARRITVVTFCEPFYTESNPEPGHIRLFGPSGETLTAQQIEGSSQSHSAEDLAPGAYTVEIDDPRYLPWTRSGVMPGERVDAHLVGSAALRLSVIDAAGQPVERYGVRVTLRSSEWEPNEFELHDGKTPLRDGLLRGMIPGDYTIAIRCADGTTARCEVDSLASSETRSVRLELGSQLFVAGRVVYPGGEGIRGAEVRLLTPAKEEDSVESPILELGGKTVQANLYRCQLAIVEADGVGGFRFDVTSPGPFLVCARAKGAQAFSPAFTLDASRNDLELVLPRPGTVRGRVRGPAGANFEGLALWIAPSNLLPRENPSGLAGLQRVQKIRESLEHALTPLGADGSFELTHLPPGPSRAFLVITAAVSHGFSLTEDGISGAQRLDELDVPAGGVLERDFAVPELPGWIAFELRVNGQPAPFVDLRVLGPIDLDGRTDDAGRFGPKRAPAGTWRVWSYDRKAGWDGFLSGEVLVEAGREASATLDAQVIPGTLTCVGADGLPIAGESVVVVRPRNASGHTLIPTSPVGDGKTDANGRLALQLMPGEYALQRGTKKAPWDLEGASPFTWTSSGPLTERVQL